LRRSVSQLGAIPAEDAGGLRRRETLARTRGLLGDVLRTLGRYEEAVREINEALRVSGALVDMEPYNPQYRDTRAGTSVSLAIVLGILGRRQAQAS